MNGRVACIVALSLVVGGPALACDYPSGKIDAIPRGNTASAQEMDEARKRVARYVKALEDYAACIETKPGGSRERDRAITEAESAADKINREIRQFNRSMQLRQAST